MGYTNGFKGAFMACSPDICLPAQLVVRCELGIVLAMICIFLHVFDGGEDENEGE